MKSPRNSFFPLAIALLCLPVACNRTKTMDLLDFPSTPQISTENRFALVIDPYISLRDQPGEKGITISHGRRGEIFAIKGKRLIQTGKYPVVWVDLGTGWALEKSIQYYSSAEKAKTAASLLQ